MKNDDTTWSSINIKSSRGASNNAKLLLFVGVTFMCTYRISSLEISDHKMIIKNRLVFVIINWLVFVIIIIIIFSYHQHGYPWLFFATSPHRSSLSVGLRGYTRYPHRAAVCRFELVALLLLGHVKGSIGVHPYLSSSVPHVWSV